MAINEQDRQVEIASEAEALTRTLAHSTHEVPVPADSYAMLGDLTLTAGHLRQVCQQLSTWHQRVTDGAEYEGEDTTGDGGTATVTAAHHLGQAAQALSAATDSLSAAHVANGRVRWT